MNKKMIITAIVASFVVFSSSCGNSARHEGVYISELEASVKDLEGQLADKDSRIRELESMPPKTIEKKADVSKDFAGSGADVSWKNGELIISIDSDILFRSGSATLTRQAKKSIKTITTVLKRKYTSNFVRVEGHTDNQPLRRTKAKWGDNWTLSGARAKSVLKELLGNGISKTKISFAGYADNQPVGSNKTNSGRSKNRRVVIVVLPVK